VKAEGQRTFPYSVRRKCDCRRWVEICNIADFENEEGGHKPRNAGGLQKLEKARKQIIP
jgi:hypothetical protein